MRILSNEMQASLSQSAVTISRGFILKRVDGQEFCFCDHDRASIVNGHSFTPIKSMDLGYGERVSGLASDSNNVLGGFEIDVINEQDVICGKWDNAAIEIIVFDWQNPISFQSIFNGYVTTINQTDNEFEFEISGIKAKLENQIGRVFGRNCDAVLGDSKCRINLLDSAYNFEAQIIAYGVNNINVKAPTKAINYDYFTFGKAIFNNGILGDYHANINAIKSDGNNLIISFDKNLPIVPKIAQTDETIRCFYGCDKSFATCKSRFGNGDNFRGCPHIPGQSDAFVGPSVAGNDGGSRQ